MKRINLQGRQASIIGLNGSGKSNFVKWFLSSRNRHLVVDPMKEYKPYNSYEPKHTRGVEAKEELNQVVDKVVKPNLDTLNYFVVDEVNRFVPRQGNLTGGIGEVIDLRRHYDIGALFITRRPQQLHTDMRELSDYIFIFNLAGKTTLKFLDEMAGQTRQAVQALGDYQCVMLDPKRNITVLDRCPNMDGKKPDIRPLTKA